MTDARLTRRTLVYGTGALAVTGTLIQADPATGQHDHAPATPVGTPGTDAMPTSADSGGYQFFGAIQAELVGAMAGRIMPSDELGPGAVEAGVVSFIDRALAGFYADDQATYQRGLLAVDRFAEERFGSTFASLDATRQDELLTAMEAGTATGFDVPASDTFFELVRKHVMEGFLADPVYGANRDFIGWRTVNFPGAVFAYTPDEMQTSQVLDKPPVGLAQWYAPLE